MCQERAHLQTHTLSPVDTCKHPLPLARRRRRKERKEGGRVSEDDKEVRGEEIQGN